MVREDLTSAEVVKGYIRGRIKRPNPAEDPEGADNWKTNDALAVNNITDPEAPHVVGCGTSRELWQRLEAVQEILLPSSHQYP